MEECTVTTYAPFRGSKYCQIDTEHRVIIIKNVYTEQDSYQAETAISWRMRNPLENFRPEDFGS